MPSNISRRSFLSATGMAAAVPASSITALAKPGDTVGLDWNKVRNGGEQIIRCRQFHDGKFPDIQLHVAVKAPDPNDLGKDWDTPNVTRFELVWDKQKMTIPARFWNDISRMPLESYPESELKNLPDAQRWKLQSEIRGLRRPKLSLSAGKGTVLIEWTRSEECDSSSTFRWLVAKNGTVLRHHDMEYHEC